MNNRNQIVKQFSIGFIPLLVFLVAEYFYGVVVGLAVAMAFSLAELAYLWFRHRRVDTFILVDVGLLLVLAGISIVLDSDLLFKLKPAVMEFILVGVLAVHGFTRHPVLLWMMKRYMAGMEPGEAQKAMLKTMARFLALIFLLHTALIVWSAYYWSDAAWAFVSGGLFYVIMAVVFAGQWFYLKRKGRANRPPAVDDDEEWFDLVDEQGRITGRAPRSRVHGDPRLLHPVVHVHVLNEKGQLLLQKRSAGKELYPACWDTAVGGHVASGENIMQALMREAREELNIDARKAVPLFRYVMRNDYESELVHTFLLRRNGPFRHNREEIEEVRFWSPPEIEENTGEKFTPNLLEELKMLREKGLLGAAREKKRKRR